MNTEEKQGWTTCREQITQRLREYRGSSNHCTDGTLGGVANKLRCRAVMYHSGIVKTLHIVRKTDRQRKWKQRTI